MEKILEVKEVSKIFYDNIKPVTALDEISFSLKRGEDLAIVGPSGSGKTTILQIIGGLDRPSKGEVFIDGQDIAKLSDLDLSELRNKKVGFIFQLFYLQDYLTALENVMIPILVNNVSKQLAAKKAKKLLTKMGIGDRVDHLPNQLSGGEQQRVAIARALANDPKIILADEPTGKLDKKNGEIVMRALHDVSKEGVSVVVITHAEWVAQQFTNSIKIENGKIIK